MEHRNSVLIVEDDVNINGLLKEALEKEGYICTQAFSGTEARMILQGERYSVILLDLMLPGIPGEEVLRDIRKKGNTPVIILTAKDTIDDKVEFLRGGADDYVTKPYNTAELMARVKSQLRRYTKLGNLPADDGENVYQVGGLLVNDDLKEVSVEGEPVKLTPIEYNILLLLVKNPGKVFSIEQIYESIWNEEAIGADNTVAVHIRHIREKIEINPKEPRYLKVVWGIGYKIEKQ